MSEAIKQAELSPALSGKYRLINGAVPGISIVTLFNKAGKYAGQKKVDFTKITVKEADDLIAGNCRCIEKIEKELTPKPDSTPSTKVTNP
jgi:hypothetical protein